MAQKKTPAAEPEFDRRDPKNRCYVGVKETAAYVVYDMSQSFNINKYREDFVKKVLQVDLRLQGFGKIVIGVWDIVNDLFSGAIVDKARTRFGKFRPFLLILAVPGTLLSAFYWLLPLLFKGVSETSLIKFFTYLIMEVILEGVGTFQGIARGGLLATITPYPKDRTRLIALANFASGFLGEKLPQQVFSLLQDAFRHELIGKVSMIPKLYMSMGVISVVIAGIGAFWFFCTTKERISQSEVKPTLRQSFQTVVRNRPMLMLALSDALGSFSLGGSQHDYMTDVLDIGSLGMVTGLPGAVVHPLSYALVPWFRRHFTDKTLFIMGKYSMDVFAVPLFFFGMIGGKKNGMYTKPLPMGIALTIYETCYMFFYGVRSVIPSELYNESMDYCEWKNGYRGEAMISVVKGVAEKVPKYTGDVASKFLLKHTGYDIRAYVEKRAQNSDTQVTIFAQWTILSFLVKLPGIIPALFYNLDKTTKEQMYAELHARRAAMAQMAEKES